MRLKPVLIGSLVVVALAGACSRSEETPGTTSLPEPSTTVAPTVAAPAATTPASTAATDATAGTDEPEAPATTLVAGMPSYQVAERIEGTDGEEIVVIVEPGTYTNVELENLVYDIVDRFAPLTALVVDDEAAVALALAEELTEEEATFLESHTFLELVDGVDVTFHGPYADFHGIIIGS